MSDIWDRLLKSEHIVITMHRYPDGDAIGSALGLYNMLSPLKKVSLFNISSELPKEFSFLQGYKKIKAKIPLKYDLLVVLDSGSFELLGIEKPDVEIINIDHHENNERYGTFNLIRQEYPSCCEVVFELLEANGIRTNRAAATCLYAGIAADTQFFSTDRVKEATFETAKKLLSFGADAYDIAKKVKQSMPLCKARLYGEVFRNFSLLADGMISAVIIDEQMQKRTGAGLTESKNIADEILALATVEVSIMIFIINKREIKVSLRSKGSVDVSSVAVKYGGNGHRNAAGIYLKDADAQVFQKILIKELEEMINE